MKFSEVSLPRPCWRGWPVIAIAAVALCSCSVGIAAILWNGRGTTEMTVDEAWDVIEDPSQPENRKQLATTQLFRLCRVGECAIDRLRELAGRDGACGEAARRHLKKLRK